MAAREQQRPGQKLISDKIEVMFSSSLLVSSFYDNLKKAGVKMKSWRAKLWNHFSLMRRFWCITQQWLFKKLLTSVRYLLIYDFQSWETLLTTENATLLMFFHSELHSETMS